MKNILKDFLKIILFSIRGFLKDQCTLWAAALTYTTVFSTIPLLAVAFSIFHACGGFKNLERLVRPHILRLLVPGAQNKVIELINTAIDRIDAETLGITGSIALFITAILLLCELELSFNNIWGIKSNRSFFKRVLTYSISLAIGPFFLAIASLITFTIANTKFIHLIEAYVNVNLLSFIPYFFIWIAFVSLYIFIPCTQINFSSAFLGGIIGGTLWQIAGWGFSLYTTKVVSYSTLYGSLGVIPTFLLWLFISWSVFFLGFEICFYHQNLNFFKKGLYIKELSYSQTIFLTWKILFYLSIRDFQKKSPFPLKELSSKSKIPGFLIEKLLQPLIEKRVIIKTKGKEKSYTVTHKLNNIELKEIIPFLWEPYKNLELLADDCEEKYISQFLESLVEEYKLKFGNMTFGNFIKKFIEMNKIYEKESTKKA